MIKKIALIVSILTGLFLILIFSSVFFLGTAPVHAALEEKTNAKIPGSLSWQKLNLSLFTGSIDLQQFQLKGPDRNISGTANNPLVGGSNFPAGGILADLTDQSLQKSLKDALGMDYFEIDMGDIDSSGAREINVTIGKELSRQITVKYGVDVKNGEIVQRVTTDYKILENFLMRGFQDTGGDFGGELKYRLEFR